MASTSKQAALDMLEEAEPFPRANGRLTLHLGWRGLGQVITVYGGPFVRGYQPGPDTYGICLVEDAPSKPRPDVHMPIQDFSIPEDPVSIVQDVMRDAIFQAMHGKKVYVGCLGGWGRTGLFLSILAKACGVENPILYVRLNYTPHAVETDRQVQYVDSFDVAPLRRYILLTAVRKRFPFLRGWVPAY